MKHFLLIVMCMLSAAPQMLAQTDTVNINTDTLHRKQTAREWFKSNVPFWFSSTDSSKQKGVIKKWFDNVHIRGYVQVRYNRLAETNADLKCEQCDRSWGDGGGISFRRIRVIIFGQLTPRIYFYIQPDFASSASSNALHFAQVRDAYIDLGIDKRSEFRVRVGQSKVPYGFENMQSSQNRMPLDRADALNSAFANERDLGVFFYWAPKKIRERFSMLVAEGYKGSGDYGVLGVGVFNGQGANRPELNKDKHVVARLSYPFQVKSQIFEPGVQAYTGKFELADDQLSSGVKYQADKNYIDQRIAFSFVLYPRPFGIMAEYNFGRGPQFNKHTDSIEVQKLQGGYVTLSYMAKVKNHVIIPFVRGQFYDGGKKHEKDARAYSVREVEIGLEWQPVKFFEFVAMYTISSRRFEDFGKQDNLQGGRLLRLQAQLNF